MDGVIAALLYFGPMPIAFTLTLLYVRDNYKTKKEFMRDGTDIAIFVTIVWPFVLFMILAMVLVGLPFIFLCEKFTGLFWKD